MPVRSRSGNGRATVAVLLVLLVLPAGFLSTLASAVPVPAAGPAGVATSADPGTGSVTLASTTDPSGRGVNCTPPGSGSWVITLSVSCDTATSINGNVTIASGGSLEFLNTTVTINNPGQDGYIIRAQTGSTFRCRGATVKSAVNGTGFTVIIEAGVTFSMAGCTMEHFGSKDPERWRNAVAAQEINEYNRYLWVGPGFTFDTGLTGNDGLVVRSTPVLFRNNTFRNYTVIRISAPNSIVEGNTFENITHEGLAFLAGANDTIVRDNTFRTAKRMDREIHGLRFYPAIWRAEITRNNFSWLPSALMIANIPPWNSGQSFQIHHNRYEQVMSGIAANIRNSRIHNETFENIMRGASIEASANTVVEDSTFSNLTFQMEVENVINRAYYLDVAGRGLFLNDAYWMWGFYCSKFFLSIGWWGDGITVRNNRFTNAPPWSIAISTDQAQGLQRLAIKNNTFERIGTYIPSGYIVREDWTGQNMLLNQTPISSAAVLLEGSDAVTIEDNTILDSLHGVITSGTDSLGNFGSLRVTRNLFRGVGRYSYPEAQLNTLPTFGGWWGANQTVWEDGIGVATGMRYINGGTYNWSNWIGNVYRANSTQTIDNNTFFDVRYPISIDFNRAQGSAGLMGTKTARVHDNLFLNYSFLQYEAQLPNSVILSGNVLEPVYPTAFPNVTSPDAHTRVATGRYYLVPGLMYYPTHTAADAIQWYDAHAVPVAGSRTLTLAYSIDDGTTWTDLAVDGSLAAAVPNVLGIGLRTNMARQPRLTGALQYDFCLTYQVNQAPLLAPFPPRPLNGWKNQTSFLNVTASDPDLDTLSIQWSATSGPGPVTLAGANTASASFVPAASGVYTFHVDVADPWTSVGANVSVAVANRAPAVTASGPAAAWKRDPFTLTAAGTDPDLDGLSYLWVQTAGPLALLSGADTPTLEVNATEIGLHAFQVTVTDGEAVSAPSEFQLEVLGRPPTAVLDISPADPFQRRTTTTYTVSGNRSLDPDGTVSSYRFDFGDNDDTGWVGESVWDHEYPVAGNYTITLIVIDDDGNVSLPVAVDIVVLPMLEPPLEIGLGALPSNPFVGEPTELSASAKDTDGTIVRYEWDFADGSTAIGQRQTHSYARAGDYRVVARAIDNDGLWIEGSVMITVRVRNGPPVITHAEPDGNQTYFVGTQHRFEITVVDPEADPLGIVWFVDGSREGTNSTTFVWRADTVGTHTISVQVSDGHSPPVTWSWLQTVVARPAVREVTAPPYGLIAGAVILAVLVMFVVTSMMRRRREPPAVAPTPPAVAPLGPAAMYPAPPPWSPADSPASPPGESPPPAGPPGT